MHRLIKKLKILLKVIKDKKVRSNIFWPIFFALGTILVLITNTSLVKMPYQKWLDKNLPAWLAIVDFIIFGACFVIIAIPKRSPVWNNIVGIIFLLSASILSTSGRRAPIPNLIIFTLSVFLFIVISYYFRSKKQAGKLKQKIKEEAKTPHERAIYYFEKGEFEKAIQETENLLSKEPENWGLYSLLGNCWHYLGKYELAIANYKKAMEINPEELEDRESLANAYAYSGRSYEEAIKLIEEVLKIFSSEKGLRNLIPFAKLSLAFVHYKKGEIQSAIQYFDEAVPEIIKSYKKGVPEIDPWMAEDHYQMGILYAVKGMKEEALKEFKKSIQCSPKSWFAKESEKMIAEIKNSLQKG